MFSIPVFGERQHFSHKVDIILLRWLSLLKAFFFLSSMLIFTVNVFKLFGRKLPEEDETLTKHVEQ